MARPKLDRTAKVKAEPIHDFEMDDVALNNSSSSTRPLPQPSSGHTVPDDTIMHNGGIGDSQVIADLQGSSGAVSESTIGKTSTLSPSLLAFAYPEAGGTPDIPLHDNMSAQSDTAMDVLSKPVKELMKTVDKLRDLGVETSHISLPQAVTIGDQSAGKSSLIEALSGIKVPRSSGTCTRCPLQIITAPSTDAPWHCTITLVKKYSFYDTIGIDDNDTGPYGPWVEDSLPHTMVFAETHTQDHLDHLLRRAQLATLNPGDNPVKYLQASVLDNLPIKVEFSPNVIRLDIAGPGLASLSFFDLPGVINQTEDVNKPWLVKVVKNLAREYVRNQSSLILLACSMEGDLANSTASSLVRKIPGAVDRCIGVLTKPDRLPTGDPLSAWYSVLAGGTFAVGHGYFVTKQPSQNQLDVGMTHDQARQAENNYFSREPWTTTFSLFEERFGTRQLQAALSQKLTRQIQQSLPTIEVQLAARIRAVEAELSQYPEPPNNAYGRIIEALNNFATHVKHSPDSDDDDGYDFSDELRRLEETFKLQLKSLRPGLLTASPKTHKPSTPSSTFIKRDLESEIVELSSGDEIETPSKTFSSKKRKLEDSISLSRANSPLAMRQFNTPQRRGAVTNGAHGTPSREQFTLASIKRTLERRSRSNIPKEVDPRAVDYLRRCAIGGWSAVMKVYLDGVSTVLNAKLQSQLTRTCTQWQETEFYRECTKIVSDVAATFKHEQMAHGASMFRLESEMVFTLSDAIDEYQQRELKDLMAGRYLARIKEHFKEADPDKDPLNQAELKNKAQDQKLRLELGADPFQTEVEVMSRVRGYYAVASARFLDNIVHRVRVDVADHCRHRVHKQLQIGLEIGAENAHEHCSRLLAENPDRERKRAQLKKERANLVQAQQQLALLAV